MRTAVTGNPRRERLAAHRSVRRIQNSPVGERVGSALRAVVLLAVFLMTKWSRLAVTSHELDWALMIGAAYVLITTFVHPPMPATRAHRTVVLTTLDILLITWLVHATDGVSSELYILYYLPVLQAGLRLDLRDAVGASVLATVCYLFVGLVSGPVRVPIQSTGVLRMATFSISAIVIAILLGLLAKQARSQRSERERAQELLNRTSAIYEIARALNATLDLDDLVAALAETAVRECGADAARVTLVTDDRELDVREAVGRPDVFRQADAGLDAANWIMKNEEILAIKAERVSPRTAEGMKPPGEMRHYLGAPMIAKGRLVGVIEMALRGGEGFRDVDEDLLTVISAQAAVAIDNARQYGRAQLLAMTDRLTGLWNHAELHQRLREEIARAQRHGRPMSLLFADLDNFKAFNDTHGHRMGDELLREVAARLRATVRRTDFAARYGGDEFAVILPETSINGASVACDNLRRTIGGEPFKIGSQRVRVTVSGGLAAYPEGGATAEDLIDACDRALREAKRGGGNYITVGGRQG
jgi:diguanylate cyclase (GGDEF)-like protein